MALEQIDPPKRNLKVDRTLFGEVNEPGGRINQPYFIDMESCETLILQTVPIEMDYDAGQNWNVVASPGRNTPLYQYTGAEDTLSFTISWYANEESRQDVWRKIKWLESLSKNDGYDKKPRRVKFMMGELFNDALWIIFSTPVKLSMFNRLQNMMPCLATHEITLKRILTTNRSFNAIRKIDT